MGTREELEEWVRPKLEAWSRGVYMLSKIAKRYPRSAYAGLGVLLQIEWQYLQINVPGVGSMMGPIEDTLKEAMFPSFFRGEEVSAKLR